MEGKSRGRLPTKHWSPDEAQASGVGAVRQVRSAVQQQRHQEPRGALRGEGAEVTLQRFQAIILKLGNQVFIRHYLWLNYPNPYQLMGIQLLDPATLTLLKPSGLLSKELLQEGFRFEEPRGMWLVNRRNEPPDSASEHLAN